MPFLRDIAYAVAGLASSPLWGWRMLRTGKWRTDWPGRFGHAGMPRNDPRPRLLIHAVSVGEVNAIRQLVDQLARTHGNQLQIVIATTTDTGQARARELFGPQHIVVRYPLDFTRCVRRFLDSVRPAAVALVELEVWPTFVAECTRRNIPVSVINGRLSERSHRRYRWIRPLIRNSFARLHAAAVQDEAYAARFRDMGVHPDRVLVTGTMKWDTARLEDDVPGSAALAEAMGIDRKRPLVVCGSTGDGEEEFLARAFQDDDLQLLIAPRKPERFEVAAAAMPGCVRRSGKTIPSPLGKVRRLPDFASLRAPSEARGERGGSSSAFFLLDTLGELGKAYALADVVIVGRTFSPMGGSDMIEPIALGKATIVGPHVENFSSTVETLRAGGGIVQVENGAGLRTAVLDLLQDTLKRRGLAERGRAVIRNQQGATGRTAELINAMLAGVCKL